MPLHHTIVSANTSTRWAHRSQARSGAGSRGQVICGGATVPTVADGGCCPAPEVTWARLRPPPSRVWSGGAGLGIGWHGGSHTVTQQHFLWRPQHNKASQLSSGRNGAVETSKTSGHFEVTTLSIASKFYYKIDAHSIYCNFFWMVNWTKQTLQLIISLQRIINSVSITVDWDKIQLVDTCRDFYDDLICGMMSFCFSN